MATITPLPLPVPTRQDPASFDDRADLFLSALPTFGTEANALAADVTTKSSTASTAATTATTQAGVATTQAGIATTQAGIATTQAGVATTQASGAATSYLNFQKQYLGAKAANPTLDNQGAPLQSGMLYWNTASNEMRSYTGGTWLSAYTTVNLVGGQMGREQYTATAGQTVFTTVGSYTVGVNSIFVYINGVRQFNDAYTETDANTITFSEPLQAGDKVLFEIGLLTGGTTVFAGNTTCTATALTDATNVQDALVQIVAILQTLTATTEW